MSSSVPLLPTSTAPQSSSSRKVLLGFAALGSFALIACGVAFASSSSTISTQTINVPHVEDFALVGDSPAFSKCGGFTESTFKVTGVTVSPTYPISKGANFVITTSGHTDIAYAANQISAKVDVKVAGFSIYSTTQAIMTNVPAGDFSYDAPAQTIPSIAPSGTYSIEVSYLDSKNSNKAVDCIDISLKVN